MKTKTKRKLALGGVLALFGAGFLAKKKLKPDKPKTRQEEYKEMLRRRFHG